MVQFKKVEDKSCSMLKAAKDSSNDMAEGDDDNVEDEAIHLDLSSDSSDYKVLAWATTSPSCQRRSRTPSRRAGWFLPPMWPSGWPTREL